MDHSLHCGVSNFYLEHLKLFVRVHHGRGMFHLVVNSLVRDQVDIDVLTLEIYLRSIFVISRNSFFTEFSFCILGLTCTII